jgi:hypothetical protein
MTQIHPCTNCKKDSIGGGSIVYGGMFFKMCPECLEDEEVLRQMNEYWKLLDQEKEDSLNIST